MFKKIKLDSRHMRQAMSLLVALLLVGSVSYLGEQFYRSSHAATGATMSVNPSTANPTTGSTLTVTIRENSGTDTVNSVQSAVNYDSSQLQYLSMSEGDFPTAAATKTTTGSILVARYSTGGALSGDHAVITLNFKVLASSGSTTISIDRANSGVNRSTDDADILAAVNNGTYTIPAPATQVPATASATLSIQPSSGTYAKGATFNVDVHVSSSARLTVVEPIIQYDASQLQFVKVTNSAAFPIAAVDQTANGVLDITRAISGGSSGVTGDNVVFTLQFKVLGGSGSTSLAFKSTSDIEDNSRTGKSIYDASGSHGATYTLNGGGTAVVPTPTATTPPATGSGQTGGTTGGSGGSTTVTISTNHPVTVVTRSGGLSISTGNAGSGVISQTSDDATQVQGEVSFAPTFDPGQGATGDSIVKVEYYLGNKLVATSTNAPFTYKFDTKKLKNGRYAIVTKTYYRSGTFNSSNDALVVRNPVTLSYVLVHYTSQISLTIIAVLIAAFALGRFILPSLHGRFGQGDGGYDGYTGYVSPAMSMAPAMPEAPDPTVITPAGQPIQQPNYQVNPGAVQQGQIPTTYIAPQPPQTPQAPVQGIQPGSSITPNQTGPTPDPNHQG